MKVLRAIVVMVIVLASIAGVRAQFTQVQKSSILNTKHDFRAVSTTTVKSNTGVDPCVFCHTPHNATPGPELWNHKMGTTSFPTYESTTMQSTIGVISETDSSKLCLSCHDGTIALASTVNNGDIDFMQGADYKLPLGSANNLAGDATIGFRDDHPFAFTPNTSNPEIKLPVAGDAVRLEDGKVQCVSCHDPHVERIDTTQGKFLVKVNQGSALCLTCHEKTGWNGSVHQLPPASTPDDKYTAAQGAHTGYIGVANNGCESCHRPHTAGDSQRLLKFVEENTCYQCHAGGAVATLDIKADFQKTYRHPVEITRSSHEAAEGPVGSLNPLPETSVSTARHAECSDCHNSHVAKNSAVGSVPNAPNLSNPLLGASGWSTAKTFKKQASYEYEICFKCHSDSANRPQLNATGISGIGFGRQPNRQFNQGNADAFNTRVEFTLSVSFHPVTRVNPSAGTSSLRDYMIAADGTDTNRRLNATTSLYCSDCHASDTNRTLGAGNSGATGPHGSSIQHLLERQYVQETPPPTDASNPVGTTGTPIGYSLTNYALCDKCHKVETVIYANLGGFPRHQEHINQTSCSTCHDSHSSKTSRLINFDLDIVGPNSLGQLQFTPAGPGHGSCALRCHNHDHLSSSY